tara:strand:+ start:357 stop:812 length:456 start_codon:yes stop_codon:yes gene_type:complete
VTPDAGRIGIKSFPNVSHGAKSAANPYAMTVNAEKKRNFCAFVFMEKSIFGVEIFGMEMKDFLEAVDRVERLDAAILFLISYTSVSYQSFVKNSEIGERIGEYNNIRAHTHTQNKKQTPFYPSRAKKEARTRRRAKKKNHHRAKMNTDTNF